jgi:hypothetical protein
MMYRLEPGMTYWEELVWWWNNSPDAHAFRAWFAESVLSWLPMLVPATLFFLGCVLWVQALMTLWKLWKISRKK